MVAPVMLDYFRAKSFDHLFCFSSCHLTYSSGHRDSHSHSLSGHAINLEYAARKRCTFAHSHKSQTGIPYIRLTICLNRVKAYAVVMYAELNRPLELSIP